MVARFVGNGTNSYQSVLLIFNVVVPRLRIDRIGPQPDTKALSPQILATLVPRRSRLTRERLEHLLHLERLGCFKCVLNGLEWATLPVPSMLWRSACCVGLSARDKKEGRTSDRGDVRFCCHVLVCHILNQNDRYVFSGDC